MNKLAARSALLAVGAILSLAIAPPADDLDTFIQSELAKRQVNGLSLAIIQDGRIAETRAYGVTARGGAPVTTATLFQAGSISKPVAAAGALRLVDQGKLALDENVNDKLKSWKVPDNQFTQTEKVTLRRLLSHTAGLTVHGFPGYDVNERMPTAVQVLDGAGNTAAIRVDVRPGSIWRYSGGGYTVLQQMVADVTGKPFPQYMSEAVLGPVGMSHSTYQQPLPADRAAQTASGYYMDRAQVAGKWHVYPEMAAAGLWTTPSDLARFAIEIQQSLAGKSSKLLAQAMTQQMLTNQLNNFGLGLGLSGTGAARRFSHNGRDEGFDAMMMAYAETGQGLVVMINANDNSGMTGRIIEFVARKYNWPQFPLSAPAATSKQPSAVPLETVSGRYELSNNNMLTLESREGSLFVDINGLPDEEFMPIGGENFGSTNRNVRFRMTRNAAGDVDGMIWSNNGVERPVPRIGPLFGAIKQITDPDPSLTQKVEATLRAFAEGVAAVQNAQHLAPGARTNLGSAPTREFAGLRRITYLSAQDVSGRRIERHGGAVARVLFYRMETERGDRWLMVHVTSDNLITDYDVVDK